MAVLHAISGQTIDIRPLGEKLKGSVTTTLIKTDSLEVLRLVLPADKEIPYHKVPGEITVQCLEGMVSLRSDGATKVLQPGQLLFLMGDELHALKGITDSSVLVTILLARNG
jgi:quercetin dioxygenase-like cupin family protein